MRSIFKFIVYTLLLSVVTSAAFAFYAYQKVTEPLQMKAEIIDIRIARGDTLRDVAEQINTKGVEIEPLLFELLGRIKKIGTRLKVGDYEIKQGMSAEDVLKKLAKGEIILRQIAIIEGTRFVDFRQKLNAHPDLEHDSQNLTDQEILQKLKITGSSEGNYAEGLFFPDTFSFAKGASDFDVLAQSARLLNQHLAREWQNRAADLPYKTPYEALIMASIIEKETGRKSDRPMIASVFVNRLKINMRLQTDPTVIYGLGEHFDGNLRRVHLQTDSAYNTYTRAGLPPSPIALAGLESIYAALHPAQSRAFYFVAKGYGTSYFSENLDEHNRAVNQYQRRK